MTKTPIKISTLDEYINFDDGTDKRYELEDGVLLEMQIISQTFAELTLTAQQVFLA
ncbi:MAG: hypothetical protein V7K92_00645 [Nostoc sp.]|uniref:hypothetical protein n=1 Tax=Nostoc sp. TaxID=1180 RepID=UPI002FF1A5CD